MPLVHEAREREQISVHRIEQEPLPDGEVQEGELRRRACLLAPEIRREGRAALRKDGAHGRVSRGQVGALRVQAGAEIANSALRLGSALGVRHVLDSTW